MLCETLCSETAIERTQLSVRSRFDDYAVLSLRTPPRHYWKGHLRLSLVSCPIELYPATSEREKISFNQLNSKTGNRIKYKKVDAATGEEVESADIVKGYQFEKGQYVQITPEELDAVALDTTRIVEIVS